MVECLQVIQLLTRNAYEMMQVSQRVLWPLYQTFMIIALWYLISIKRDGPLKFLIGRQRQSLSMFPRNIAQNI